MPAYIAKRLLLMLPTLLGVLLLTFIVLQFVPGGPVEQYLAEAKAAGGAAEGGALTYRGGQGVDEARLTGRAGLTPAVALRPRRTRREGPCGPGT